MAKIRKIWIALLSALLSGLGFSSCSKPDNPPMYGPFDPSQDLLMYGPLPPRTLVTGPKASEPKTCEAILPGAEVQGDNGADKAAE